MNDKKKKKKKWLLLLTNDCHGWDKAQNLPCLNITQHRSHPSESLKYVQLSVSPITASLPSLRN